MPSKHFHEIIDKMREIHDRKSHDYAQDTDPFSNFTRSSQIVQWFKDPVDQVFAGIIGIKLTRLAELLNGKEAKNESANDTFIDAANYFALWGAYYLSLKDRRSELIQEMKKKMDNALIIRYHGQEVKTELWDNLEHRCVICNAGFRDMHLYCKHAMDMHSAIYDPTEGSLQFIDHERTKEVLPSLKFLLGTCQLDKNTKI